MLEVDIQKILGSFVLHSKFTLEKGKVLALLGASGEGKSLTLRCIAGIDTPDQGYIRLNGRTLFDSEQEINLPPQQRRVGYLFPQFALFPTKTVAQNILLGITKTEASSKAEKMKLLDYWLDLLQLTEQRHKKPHQLSNGQQQRVALARIFINQTEVLLLDEPFSALDPLLKWQLEVEFCKLLQSYGGSTLFVSHDIEEVALVADEVSVIHAGKTEPQVQTSLLFSNPQTYAACKLNGCRNFTRIESTQEGVYALDWGIKLPSTLNINPQTTGIALRRNALFICPADEALLTATIQHIIQTSVSTIYQLQTAEKTDNLHSMITLELPKNEPQHQVGDSLNLGIAQKDILCWQE